VAEVWGKYSTRVRDYAAQTWALTRHPSRFMTEWGEGRREALNPLRFATVGLLLSLAVRHLASRQVLGPPGPVGGLSAWLARPEAMHALILLTAVTAHPWMRLFGSRAPLRATVAAVVFAYTGPLVLLEVAAWASSLAWAQGAGAVPLTAISAWAVGEAAVPFTYEGYTHYPTPVMGAFAVGYVYLLGTLGGVHRTSWWKALLAVLGGMLGVLLLSVAVGFLFRVLGTSKALLLTP
jgi:hypothetical protein